MKIVKQIDTERDKERKIREKEREREREFVLERDKVSLNGTAWTLRIKFDVKFDHVDDFNKIFLLFWISQSSK